MQGDAPFKIKQHDTSPTIGGWVRLNGAPLDVTGATVRFLLRQAHGQKTVLINSAGYVEDGPAGLVRYQWAPGDTATKGTYLAEFEVTLGGDVFTVPNDDYIVVRMGADIA